MRKPQIWLAGLFYVKLQNNLGPNPTLLPSEVPEPRFLQKMIKIFNIFLSRKTLGGDKSKLKMKIGSIWGKYQYFFAFLKLSHHPNIPKNSKVPKKPSNFKLYFSRLKFKLTYRPQAEFPYETRSVFCENHGSWAPESKSIVIRSEF